MKDTVIGVGTPGRRLAFGQSTPSVQHRWGGLAVWIGLLSICGAGCAVETLADPPPLGNPSRDAGTPDFGAFPDVGVGGVLVARVEPPHGPFSGDQEVMIRGVGFNESAVVTFGGRTLPDSDIRVIDPNRIRVLTPAGEPGPADITVTIGDRESTLEEGFTYDALRLEPDRGSIAGGTRVELTALGITFSAGDEVLIGTKPCAELIVESGERLICKTPMAAEGVVDVTFTPAVGEPIVLTDAFTYFDASDPIAGGLGGGAIQGSVNVTVLSRFTGGPLPGAYVRLGNTTPPIAEGTTDASGQVTLSVEGLAGEQTLTVAAYCHEKTTIVGFDAASVTVFMDPWLDVGCIEIDPDDEQSGFPRVGVPRNGAFIAGELVFPGPNENAPNAWDILPTARSGELRVAYVQTTVACSTCRNPDPGGPEGTVDRITEDMQGATGNPYRIAARASALAVFAVAGIENLVTGEFRPYLLGIQRGILLGPEQELTGVRLSMNIPLDQPLDVAVSGLPQPGPRGPDRVQVQATMDLGGEGFLRPFANFVALDEIVTTAVDGTIRLIAQPALSGPLADGRYYVDAAWVTGSSLAEPLTRVRRTGVRPSGGVIELTGFVGLVEPLAPLPGGLIPADRTFRWDVRGNEPDVWMIFIVGSDGNPQWRYFAPGTARSAPVPDLSDIEMIEDVSEGTFTWTIYGINVPDFDYDSFTYSSLSSRRWTAWSVDRLTAQR